MVLRLPKIYPITDTRISHLTHTQQVAQLVSGGATLIQLRDKTNSARDFYEDASNAVRVAQAAGVLVIVNDRVDLALALQADGVHLGQTDMPVRSARRILGDDAIIGYSTHNIEQVKEGLQLPIDYLAYGPVFQTRSKLNPDPIAGLESLKAVKVLCGSIPFVAIGGIARANLLDVFSTGVDSAALISAVLSGPADIAKNLRDLNDLATGQHR